MKLGPKTRRCLSVLALAVAASCRQADRAVVYDLVRAAPSAEAEFPWEYLAFGTLAARPFQEKGFERVPIEPFSDSHAATRLEPQVLLRWREPAPRLAVLDAAAFPGSAGASARVRLNSSIVGRLVLEDGRRRYAFLLPVEVQRPGGNRLQLEFATSAAAAAASAASPGLLARLYGLSVGLAADADLEWLSRDGAPPALGIVQGPESRALVQAGPSAVRFAFRAPGRAELRFAPDLHPRARGAGAAAVLTVAVEDASGTEREIWRQRVVAADRPPGEVVLELPVREALPATVILRVTPDAGRRPAWGLWQGLRVLGDRNSVVAEEPAAPEPTRADETRPRSVGDASVLLIILDAAAVRHFGCYGYGRRTTPEIDRIAGEGVVYERAYSPAVFTRTSMASVWTSQPPDQHRVGVDENVGISAARPTLAELLSARGVHAAGFIGNPVARGFGLDRGFHEFHSIYTQKINFGLVTHAEEFRKVLPGFFQGRQGKFFAYVHYLEPHFPYDPPPPFNTLFGPDAPLTLPQRREKDWFSAVNEGRVAATPQEIEHLTRLYDGGLAYVDREVGLLRQTLEQAGLWDRLLVLISSDHGEGLREHGWIGHMKQVHEEAAHVPLIVRYPAGKGPRGSRVKEVVSLLDVAPTIADALGVTVPPGTFAGRSLLRAGTGSRVVTRNSDLELTYAVTEDRYRLIFQTTDRAQQLYDVAADPGETRDLAGAQPAWASAYRQALQRFLLSLRPEKPEPIRPLSPADLEAMRALGYVN